MDGLQTAILGLWAIDGIGTQTIAEIVQKAGSRLTSFISLPTAAWVDQIKDLSPGRRQAIREAAPLEQRAERCLRRCRAARMEVAFSGDRAYPEALVGVADMPPVLFWRGTPPAPRRRLAMVGSRSVHTESLSRARRFAQQVAERGVGVVSGAAAGVDSACHDGALDVRGETWAFMGSSLDQLDSAQAKLVPRILDGGGAVFSEYPPGVRASRSTFPRRNRLISAASNAVLVVRAHKRSGALLTAQEALDQGRPVWALPGELDNPEAAGCNSFIAQGKARLCTGVDCLLESLGRRATLASKAPVDQSELFRMELGALSDAAQRAYGCLGKVPRSFDDVYAESALDAGALTGALCELELAGLAVQHPGRRFERI